jgi:hypothetical protein
MNIYCFLRVMRSAYKEVYPRLSTINSDDLSQELQWLLPAAVGYTLLLITYKIMLFEKGTRYLTQHTPRHDHLRSRLYLISFSSLVSLLIVTSVFTLFPSTRPVLHIIIFLLHISFNTIFLPLSFPER